MVTNIINGYNIPNKHPILFKFDKVDNDFDVYNSFYAVDDTEVAKFKKFLTPPAAQLNIKWALLARIRRTGEYVTLPTCKRLMFTMDHYTITNS
jgi:hypothetical protein